MVYNEGQLHIVFVKKKQIIVSSCGILWLTSVKVTKTSNKVVILAAKQTLLKKTASCLSKKYSRTIIEILI